MSSSPAFDFLYGFEKLYKADIASVLLYLMEEARSNRVVIPKRANTAADTRGENAYLVAINDIVPFARLVMAASKEPTPTIVLDILSRIIRSHRRCNVWYQGQPIDDASLESTNRSHQQFNDVLDELFDVLVQKYIQGSAEDSREQLDAFRVKLDPILAGKSASDILDLEVGDFAYHELVQDNFERMIGSKSKPVPNEPQKQKMPKPPVDYQVGETIDDIRFALFNLFKDLNQIRTHVDDSLNKYMNGGVGHMHFGAVINSVIGIVRNIETKFLRSLPQPQFSSWEDVMSFIATPSHLQAISECLSDGPEPDFLSSIYGLPFQQLQQFREFLKAETFTSYRVDQAHFLGPKPSYRDSEKRQMTILNEYLHEVALLDGGETLASEDELTRGILNICEGARSSFENKAETIHLWIVFGLQLFLDTEEQLGLTMNLSLEEATATVDIYGFSIEPDVQYSPDTEKTTFPGTSWIDRDEYLKQRRLGKITISRIPSPFLPQIPIVCGNLQCGIFAKSQSEQITKSKRSPVATAAACLYNAVRNEGYLDRQWQDMEFLIRNYDSAEILEGQPPNDANEYYNHFAVSIDSYYVKRSEKRESQVSGVVKTFEKLLCQTDPSKTNMTMDLVEGFLHQTAHLQGMGKKKQNALLNHWNKTHTLKSTQLLTFLEDCLTENEPMLDFNYYAFYKSCFLLMRLVEAELHHELQTFMSNLPNASSGDLEEDFRWLLVMVLLDFQYTLVDGLPPDKMLIRVGGVFREFLERYAGSLDEELTPIVDDDRVLNGMCIHWGSCKWLGTRHSALKFQ